MESYLLSVIDSLVRTAKVPFSSMLLIRWSLLCCKDFIRRLLRAFQSVKSKN